MSEENETPCPWESSISPRAKIIGRLLLLLLVLAIPAKKVIPFVTGGFVRGVVLLKGQPQEGFEIRFRMVEPMSGGPPPEWNQHVQLLEGGRIVYDYSAITNGNGAFWLCGLKPGTFTVLVLKPCKTPPGQYLIPRPNQFEVNKGFQKVEIFVTDR